MPRDAKKTIQFRELAERRIITKGLNGAAAWLRAKVGVFPIDIQFEQRGDVYEMVVKVTYRQYLRSCMNGRSLDWLKH
jgi:hypothetical protein